jgi:ADP-L-glycero-D-manno-heptose 6-epimerase
MSKLKAAGYDKNFHTLEEGIADYVGNYLMKLS